MDVRHYRPTGRYTGRALQRGIDSVGAQTVPWGSRGGGYRPILVQGVTGWTLGDGVRIATRVPPTSDVGPMVDRHVMRRLGAESGAALRGYLWLCFDWDRYGARSGRLIRPTQPIVKRSAAGHIVDGLDRPVLGKGGFPIKSPHDPRAIPTGGREPNPGRTRYPPYGADELARRFFQESKWICDPVRRSKAQQRARREVLRIECQGGCVIERLGPQYINDSLPWRVMPPDRER